MKTFRVQFISEKLIALAYINLRFSGRVKPESTQVKSSTKLILVCFTVEEFAPVLTFFRQD